MKQPIRKSIIEANGISNEKPIYTLLLDMNSLMKMCLVDKRMNGDGKEYGMVFLVLRIIGNLLLKKDFNFCVACYDGFNSGVLRYNFYHDYKANRDKHYEIAAGTSDYDREMAKYCMKVLKYAKQKNANKETVRNETDDEIFERQRSIIQEILENLCVRQFMYDSVEGDDLIANYVKNKKPNEKVVVVSGDRDLSQLISSDVCLYIPTLKTFVTEQNSAEVLGCTHKNIVLKKIICGDVSDNIKGIKGVGEQTLFKIFPEMINEEATLDAVMTRSRELLEERKANKKKPLKTLENILNSVTDGIQGDKIYEINKRLIDLSEPILTEEAKNGMSEEMYAPMDMEGRDIKNVYKIIETNGMSDILSPSAFGSLFGCFERIVKMEKKFYESLK